MAINYQERIPNNVDLGNDRALQRALEHWQPKFLDWWTDLGPEGFRPRMFTCARRPRSMPPGWATFGKVMMPDYRWGIFWRIGRRIVRLGSVTNSGKSAWQRVPGEHRSTLRRLIVTQGDTEPASVRTAAPAPA